MSTRMHAGKDRRRSLRLLSMRGPPDSMAGDECASRFGELTVKEALHIHLTPEDQRFNRHVGLELPGC